MLRPRFSKKSDFQSFKSKNKSFATVSVTDSRSVDRLLISSFLHFGLCVLFTFLRLDEQLTYSLMALIAHLINLCLLMI